MVLYCQQGFRMGICNNYLLWLMTQSLAQSGYDGKETTVPDHGEKAYYNNRHTLEHDYLNLLVASSV